MNSLLSRPFLPSPRTLCGVFLGLSLGLPGGVHAQAAGPSAKLDASKSEVLFVSKQMGVPVEGRFRKFDAQVSFDPKKPAAGKISLSIETASATLGTPEADGEMPKKTWFNASAFPQATFQSSVIKALGSGRYDIGGKLSIKGSNQDVVVPVTLSQGGAGANLITTATGTFSIKRLDFKIGDGEWADTSMVANDVQIKFKLSLSGMPAL
ncbi:MAG: YceI family protein [Leptothrix ochracea]|uniref:YceI family protein n=1 Tax=Leptothrix ochracea TaxID=735331 RepID=UPI0034E20A0E